MSEEYCLGMWEGSKNVNFGEEKISRKNPNYFFSKTQLSFLNVNIITIQYVHKQFTNLSYLSLYIIISTRQFLVNITIFHFCFIFLILLHCLFFSAHPKSPTHLDIYNI
jgi:hypothetical protein